MITYKDILYATTKILSDNFNCDVIVENKEGTFENECFYVTLVPVTSKASTSKTNEKQLMISVKYFGSGKLDNYDIADRLDFLIYITYHDKICIKEEDYELIQELNLKIKDK